MKITLDIPDALYEKYFLLNKLKSEDEVKALLKARLVRWLDKLVLSNPDDRSFFITGDDRRAIEKVFQATITDTADLLTRLKALSLVKVGPLEFNLSPGESIRLNEQAQFHGWTPEAFFRNTCQEIVDHFMDKI